MRKLIQTYMYVRWASPLMTLPLLNRFKMPFLATSLNFFILLFLMAVTCYRVGRTMDLNRLRIRLTRSEKASNPRGHDPRYGSGTMTADHCLINLHNCVLMPLNEIALEVCKSQCWRTFVISIPRTFRERVCGIWCYRGSVKFKLRSLKLKIYPKMPQCLRKTENSAVKAGS